MVEAGKSIHEAEKPVDPEQASSIRDGVIASTTTDVDDAGYRRVLTMRQIMMMTFGAGIGTGLWVSTIFSLSAPRILHLVAGWHRHSAEIWYARF